MSSPVLCLRLSDAAGQKRSAGFTVHRCFKCGEQVLVAPSRRRDVTDGGKLVCQRCVGITRMRLSGRKAEERLRKRARRAT